MWLSGSEESGAFELGLSPDVSAKVQGVLEGCVQVDDQCAKDVHDVLHSADLAIDSKIKGRDFRALISKTIKGSWDIFFDIASMLYVTWVIKDKEDRGGFDSFRSIPKQKAVEASKFETATEIVVSAGGSAIVTVKPTPNPTTLKGYVPTTVGAAFDY